MKRKMFTKLPDKKYKIIYADPPWEYNDKALAGNRGSVCKYNVISNEDLMKLPIEDIADDDCVLFMWVTFPKMNQVFDLIKAWGFTYKTCAFVWIKTNPDKLKWFKGMGRWTRSNAEVCLLATKGSPKRVSANICQIIKEPLREHSRKPDITRKLIVDLLGDLPRIEIFGRQRHLGWEIWGNQVSKSIQVDLGVKHLKHFTTT